MPSTPFQLILTTCKTKTEARKIAQVLLKKRLIACAQILGPIQSIYHWKGKLCSSSEFQVWMKAKSTSFEIITHEISRIHSYEVPEIIALPLARSSDRYARWMNGVL